MDKYLVRADGSPRPPPKHIFCIRHGESEANVKKYRAEGADRDDALYFDSPLTEVGRKQAESIRAQVAALKPEVIITSPMTRAIQTCLGAVGSKPAAPIVVEKMCSENVCCAADIGSPASVLRKRFGDGLLWGNLEENWWWANGRADCDQLSTQRILIDVKRESRDEIIQRAEDFKKYLSERPEQRIVVFAHSCFLAALFGELGTNKWMANCEIRPIFL